MGVPVHVSFVGGAAGSWAIDRIEPVVGESLPPAERLAVLERKPGPPAGWAWQLCGVAGHERYVTREEHQALVARQSSLGRPNATRAALIPIRKTAAWWELAQDERRVIFADRSRHIGIGLEYLPAVARRLYHCRDLGEPFDFLTWFEYAQTDVEAFEELVVRLRRTEEWTYVEREIDIRVSRR